MSLYAPRRVDLPPERMQKYRAPLSCRGAFHLLPAGTLIVKPSRGRELRDQVYDYSGHHRESVMKTTIA